jgi:hypothetical protein
MRTIVYKACEPLEGRERFIAYLVLPSRGDCSRFCLSTVHFFGETAQEATNRANAFWNDEIAKMATRVERGRNLGHSRRKAA